MMQSSLSLQYVKLPVASTQSGVPVNMTGDSVQMAFPLHRVAPASGDWTPSTWETDATVTPNVYYARCLVGPGGTVVLTAGLYDCWIKVTDNPEIPAEKVDELLIV